MQDRIVYTALCYVEMLSLQFTCEYTIQGVHAFKCLFNLTLNERMFGRWAKFDRQFYQPYLPHSSEALETDVKSDIFVADFPLAPRFLASVFLWGLLVGINTISCFQIVYKFRTFSKSRSLVVVASGYVYF